jgi:hypothetical protein
MSTRKYFAQSILGFAILITAFAIQGFASFDPPPNDNFANAQIITGTSGQSTPFDSSFSTREPGEPYHGKSFSYGSIWFKYTATTTGIMTINTAASNPLYDSTIAVYEGSAISDLSLVAQNDDVYGSGASCLCSLVTFAVQNGKTYHIAVARKTGSFTGPVISYSVATGAPGNDNFASAILLPNPTGAMYTTTNLNASKEAGEPNHTGNIGGRSVWYKWVAPAGAPKLYDFSIDAHGVSGIAIPLFAIYTGSNVGSLTQVGRGEQGSHSRIVFRPTPGTTYYIAIDGYNVAGGVNQSSVTLDYRQFRSDKTADFDQDGRSDFTVFRPGQGRWYYQRSSFNDELNAVRWGFPGDIPFLSEFSGDGQQDFMIYRPTKHVWWMQPSDISTPTSFQWGADGDVPLIFESHLPQAGSNTSSAVMFRPSTGVWYKYDAAGAHTITQWGLDGDIPVSADFNGDGVDDMTVFRPSTGVWYIRDGFLGGLYRAVQFGVNGDTPVVADYDGDGLADIAVFRRSNGTWYILRSSDGSFQAVQWGTATDTPQPLDWDGDGKADIAVFRTGRWFMLLSSNPQYPYHLEYFGSTDDVPVTVPRY